RGRGKRVERGRSRRHETTAATRSSVREVQVARRVEGQAVRTIEISREQADPTVGMQLRDRPPDALARQAELLSGHEQRPKTILRECRRSRQAAGVAEWSGNPGAHARQDRNAE